ncbi:MAG: hypothetical protein KKH28_06860 [Elusimicrobia bacterium]|nr:hypothetical protein [Elusimicrobiota bacterium]
MLNKSLLTAVSIEALKTAIILFALLLISRFIEILPFSGLPVFNRHITAADLLVAVVSLAAIIVFIKAGFNARPAVDELFHWLPGAGTLLNYITGIIAILFAYPAFQPVIFPFIKDFEWVYQSLFLGVTLFLLAKAGLCVYHAGEALSRAIISALQPYKEVQPKPPSALGGREG